MSRAERPAHHRPDGRFRNPWSVASGDDALRRRISTVAREWLFGSHPPDPPPGAFESVRTAHHPARVESPEVRVTWIGHATTLVQLPGLNVLTDPVWSDRCSPLGFMGPHRFVEPPLTIDELPPIDAVLISHDHYDHLDVRTVRALHGRFGPDLRWLTPLGYQRWFARMGIRNVVEADWWNSYDMTDSDYAAVCVPARHWTRRRPGGTNARLWCGWALCPTRGSGPTVYFAGDSGYCPAFTEIGRRLGPFDVSLVPIGAYEPRWFMGAVHMNPEEAAQVYRDLGAEGCLMGIHWGTWRLTFEDPLEPPERMAAAWRETGLPESKLLIPKHGQTVVVASSGHRTRAELP